MTDHFNATLPEGLGRLRDAPFPPPPVDDRNGGGGGGGGAAAVDARLEAERRANRPLITRGVRGPASPSLWSAPALRG